VQRVDLREVVENATSTHFDRALGKDIDTGFEPHSAPIEGSTWLLREVADNLMDNALAYTPRGGRITVRSLVQAQSAFLEVEDNGSGIPEEERRRVCERFYRMPGTRVVYFSAQSGGVERVSHGDAHDLQEWLFLGTKHSEAKSALIAVDLYDADEWLKCRADGVYRDT
jgi:hypothetical protein